MSVQLLNIKGFPTCSQEQVTSEVGSLIRYNATNCWNVNLATGNVNNNNTYNRYYVCGSRELLFNIDEWLEAEKECYKNKHNSFEATRLHYHLSSVFPIALSVAEGQYRPSRSYCFVLSYPVYREIFAAFPSDRIVHHYVAPFIAEVAECVHIANGNVSHGNRKRHSAHTAAIQINDNIKAMGRDSWVAKMDMRGYFMSIPKQKAYDILEYYARKYYKGTDLDEKLALCKILIMYNPAKDCVRVSPVEEWNNVPKNKSLFYAKEGCGLPIGNFYSQLVANLYLAPMDAALQAVGVKVTRFVDDITIVSPNIDKVREARKVALNIAEQLDVTIHPNKYYVQPSYRGVSVCGRTIKNGRIYCNNRSINACMYAIKTAEEGERGAKKIISTANSYLGILCHCTEFNNQLRIANAITAKYGQWLYWETVKGKIVIRLRKEYTYRYRSMVSLNQFIYTANESLKENRRNFRPRRSRKRNGSRRKPN